MNTELMYLVWITAFTAICGYPISWTVWPSGGLPIPSVTRTPRRRNRLGLGG